MAGFARVIQSREPFLIIMLARSSSWGFPPPPQPSRQSGRKRASLAGGRYITRNNFRTLRDDIMEWNAARLTVFSLPAVSVFHIMNLRFTYSGLLSLKYCVLYAKFRGMCGGVQKRCRIINWCLWIRLST